MKTCLFDPGGVLSGVTDALPDNPAAGVIPASPAVRAWAFSDPAQAKRHAAMFDAELTPAQRAKLAAVPEPDAPAGGAK